MSVMDDMLAWLTARIEQAEREAPHAHERGCFAWDDYHYRHGRDLDDPQPTAGDACECGGPPRAMARAHAERALLDTALAYLDPASEPVASGLAEYVVEYLAHGHRHDAPGFLAEWAPEGATADA